MSRERALELIKNKMRKNKAIKKKHAKRKGPYGLVTDFIKTMEVAKGNSKTALEFNGELKRESELLYDRFRQIDPDVEIELTWNRPDKVESWEDLMIEGVLIKWSRFWLGKHPLEHATKHIDISDLFMKGLLSDDD